jgi:AcrR family transcriptional regulator
MTEAVFQKKFRYHHGNLRDALLQAAQSILQEQGIEALSLRTLAKATGVTQAAPYSHFRDKNDLLAAVAEKGFQSLALGMAEAATGAPTIQTRIEKLLTAYIEFACANKTLFRLMFGREVSDMKAYPTLAMTAGKSYALISAALSKHAAPEDARFLTVALWSLCHGMTTLLVDERLEIAQFGCATVEEFVRRTVEKVRILQ